MPGEVRNSRERERTLEPLARAPEIEDLTSPRLARALFFLEYFPLPLHNFSFCSWTRRTSTYIKVSPEVHGHKNNTGVNSIPLLANTAGLPALSPV